MQVRFQAITGWPGEKTVEQKRSPFRAMYGRTLEYLNNELDRINASEVVIRTFHDASHVRLDGWLRADAREPSYPSVILEFEMPAVSRCPKCQAGQPLWRVGKDNPYNKHKTILSGVEKFIDCTDPAPKPLPVTMASDQYTDWRANIRAIAATLEALRAVERHGVVKRQQYIGLGQLPPARFASGGLSAEEAARIISKHAPTYAPTTILNAPEAARSAYRQAARATHPDQGGSHNEAAQVNLAYEVLRSKHGIA